MHKETINSYIHVSYDPASKRITCTFLGELKSNKTKSCIFAYGSCQSLDAQRKKVEIFTTTKFPDIAEMEISFNIERICYTASSTSNDSLFSVKLIDAMIISKWGNCQKYMMHTLVIQWNLQKWTFWDTDHLHQQTIDVPPIEFAIGIAHFQPPK